MNNLIRRLHAWSLQWANTRMGAWSLFICAFADSLVLPLMQKKFFKWKLPPIHPVPDIWHQETLK